MEKILNKLYVIVLSFVVVTMSFLFFLLPDKTYSEAENRTLQTAPDMNLEALTSGEFTENFGMYFADQFPLRDGFVAVKAYFELLQGKRENNQVIYAENDTLISRGKIEENRISDNISAISEFKEKNLVDLTVAALPRSIDVFSERLPINYPVEDDLEIWKMYKSEAASYELKTADLYNVLCESNEYYRTDHHYTTKGAYLTYKCLGESLGYNPLSEDYFRLETVSDSFCGTSMRSSGFYLAKEDSIKLYRYDGDTEYSIIADGQKIDLYDRSKLTTTDKYAVFLGGNHARVDITKPEKRKEKLLIIRDSFADSIVPFLAIHFDIIMVDLRYFGDSVSDIVSKEYVDKVLILESISELATARNLSYLRM